MYKINERKTVPIAIGRNRDQGRSTYLELKIYSKFSIKSWSEKRDSNPRPPPWQGGALPTELFSHLSKIAFERGTIGCDSGALLPIAIGKLFSHLSKIAFKRGTIGCDSGALLPITIGKLFSQF
jgi:hypothetical protein